MPLYNLITYYIPSFSDSFGEISQPDWGRTYVALIVFKAITIIICFDFYWPFSAENSVLIVNARKQVIGNTLWLSLLLLLNIIIIMIIVAIFLYSAEAETKLKLEKVTEIKKINAQMMAIKRYVSSTWLYGFYNNCLSLVLLSLSLLWKKIVKKVSTF